MNRDAAGAAIVALVILAVVAIVLAVSQARPDRPPTRLLPGDRLVQIGRDWILTRCDGAYGAVVLGRVDGDSFATHEPYDTACADLNRPEVDPPDTPSNDA